MTEKESHVLNEEIGMPDYIYDKSIFDIGSFKDQMTEIRSKYLKFLFIPGKRDEELEKRKYLLNRLKSKRKFAYKLKAPLMVAGILIVLFVVTLAIFAPYISVYTFKEITTYQINPWDLPSPLHPLGKSAMGRDVLGRIIWGARTSIFLGFFSIIISVTFGTMLGLFVAYRGGIIDDLIMRFVDIIFAFPSLILILIIINIYGQNLEIILFTLGFLGIAYYTRLIRGSALAEKNKPYIEAAKVSGSGTASIIFKHILPNCIAPTVISFSFDIGGNILGLAALSFLGFGDPRFVEWGFDLNRARSQLYAGGFHALLWPGLMILFTVLGFMLLGDGLRDALDPRLQGN